MVNLPCELWFIIASFTRQGDLPSLARVSSLFLKASRRALYRKVSLSDSEHLDDTLRLLRDPAMARKVERLTLCGIPPSRIDATSHVNFSIMVNLRSIAIVSCSSFFTTSKDQDTFIRTLVASCPRLKEIQYEDSGDPPSDEFSVGNIERIVWNQSGGFSRPLLSLCRASSSTITHLSILMTLNIFSVESLLAFTTMRFPQLLSIELGPWIDVDSPEMPTALTKFLMAHPTIRDLHLMYYRDDKTDSDLQLSLDINSMTPNILPNLETLDAHPDNIRSLLAARAGCLTTMSSLSISHGLSPNTIDSITDVLDDFRGYSEGMSGVRNVTLYLRKDTTRVTMGDYFDWMMDFSNVFPRLEKWIGDVPDGMSLNVFISIFSSFHSIRELDLTGWPHSDPERLAKTDTIRNLADECASLQIVKFRGDDGKLVDALYVLREHNGCGISLQWVDIEEE